MPHAVLVLVEFVGGGGAALVEWSVYAYSWLQQPCNLFIKVSNQWQSLLQ